MFGSGIQMYLLTIHLDTIRKYISIASTKYNYCIRCNVNALKIKKKKMDAMQISF